MLKGMGISSIIKLTLAITITSLFIGISTIGSLGDAMQHSIQNLGDTSNPVVEVERASTVASLTEFVRDRAVNRGCEVIEEKNEDEDVDGYEGLQDTHLTQYPECFGGSASGIRGREAFNPGGLGADENYMPGVYSTERFLIERDITLSQDFLVQESENIDPDDEDERDVNSIITALEGSPHEHSEIEATDGELNIGKVAAGSAVVGSVAGPGGTVSGAVLGASLGVIVSGIYEIVDDQPDVVPIVVFFEDLDDVSDRTNIGTLESEDIDLIDDEEPEDSLTIDLCEGDQGYIQANRGSIEDASYSDDEPLFPIIVITDTETDSC